MLIPCKTDAQRMNEMFFKTIKVKYSSLLISFVIVISAFTWLGVQRWVQPSLQNSEEKNLAFAVEEIATEIRLVLSQVQAQQRAITQTIPQLDSQQIDRLLPQLVDQYANPLVFGGGIWPLPNKRLPRVERASTFYHRDQSGQLTMNTFWNSSEAPSYYTQPWHLAGQQAPRGQCVWANAYQDGASAQPRTNCAMGIYQNGTLYGVSTIDVTLGFFNELVAGKERALNADIMIVERDGTILNKNRQLTNDNVILTNLSAQRHPFANTLNTVLRAGKLEREKFSLDGEEYILIVQEITGTPWFIAVAQPVRLLTQQTRDVMYSIAKIQLPLVALLLVGILLALAGLIRRFQELKENVDTLSAGDADLTMRLEIKKGDELDDIAISMNKFIAYLHNLVTDLIQANKTCNEQISAMSEVTIQTINVLEKHLKETDMVATAVNQLSSSAQEVAAHTQKSTEITRDVQNEVELSKRSVAKTTESVESLMVNVDTTSENVTKMERSTIAIESVLQVIGGIAEQTNLLALNAAIEAARAGETGRGFAVVADEVRNLAAKTQESTTEVAEMLGSMKSGVEITVNSMQKTREQCQISAELTRNVNQGIVAMSNAVSSVDDVSIHIATAANEQSQVIDEINKSMEMIRIMLEQLHKHGLTAVEHGDALSKTSAQLQNMVTQFKV